MLPFTRNPRPPNIFFSSTVASPARSSRICCAIASSYATSVPGDGVGDVWLFEARDLVGLERELLGGDGVFEVLDLRRADDGRRDAGLVQQPRERYPSRRHVAHPRDLSRAVDDGE